MAVFCSPSAFWRKSSGSTNKLNCVRRGQEPPSMVLPIGNQPKTPQPKKGSLEPRSSSCNLKNDHAGGTPQLVGFLWLSFKHPKEGYPRQRAVPTFFQDPSFQKADNSSGCCGSGIYTTSTFSVQQTNPQELNLCFWFSKFALVSPPATHSSLPVCSGKPP